MLRSTQLDIISNKSKTLNCLVKVNVYKNIRIGRERNLSKEKKNYFLQMVKINKRKTFSENVLRDSGFK